jgi:Cu/Zn superoxide dismutase
VATGLLLVLGVTTIAAAQEQPLTLQMTQQNSSGMSGTAMFTPTNSGLRVDLKVSGAGAGPEPAHIHPGSCTQLDPTPQFTLQAVTNGSSTTDVNTTLQALTASPHAIHLHKSNDELSVYVACADITPARLPATGEVESDTGLRTGLVGLGLAVLGIVLLGLARRRAAIGVDR